MSLKFCPDCQAECRPGDEKCPECGFPMQLQIFANGGRREIPSSELDGWHRIVQVLQRSGVQVKTGRKSDLGQGGFWWSLPIIGGFILLMTFLFGGQVADALWSRPVAQAPILDLSQNNQAQESGDDTDTSFLQSALGVTNEQRRLTEDLNTDVAQFVDRTRVSLSTLDQYGREALLSVRVRDTTRNGVMLGQEGLYLMPSDHLLGAFQSETRTVSRSGALVQETVFIVPEVGPPGTTPAGSELVEKSDSAGIALMQGPNRDGVSFPLNFDVDLSPNETVWVSLYSNREHVLREFTIVGSYNNLDGILFWELNGELQARDSGAPVFNAYGDLAGIYLNMEGRSLVLTLLRMREKTPFLFKRLR